jgi:putative ATP-binding cassette transporter
MSTVRRFAKPIAVLVAAVLAMSCDGDEASRPPSAELALPAPLEAYLASAFPDSGIPGLAVAVVVDGTVHTRAFGQARDGVPVTDRTAFELASCSKSFTALAALQLVADGRLDLAAPVSRYVPGFHVVVGGARREVTVGQLLHHTTGLTWTAIGRIPDDLGPGALRETAAALSGTAVDDPPGTRFVYSSANYDVLGAVIEATSGEEFGSYLERHIFTPLGLAETHVLASARLPDMAEGHKLGFLAARSYTAPLYRGNAPAGYVVSTARDLGRWLFVQLGLTANPLATLVAGSHVPDREVAPDHGGGSYAAGWSVYQKPGGEISHAGDNPSFTSYVGFSPGGQFGVALLASSDSPQTARLGENLMALLRGARPAPLPRPGSAFDRACSGVVAAAALIWLAELATLIAIAREIMSRRRRFRRPTGRGVAGGAAAAVGIAAIPLGALVLPRAIAGIPFETAVVWLPGSFPAALVGLSAVLVTGYAMCVASALFRADGDPRRELPQLVALSLLGGIGNAALIFLIAAAPAYRGSLAAILACYVLVAVSYLASRRYVDRRAVAIAYQLVHRLRARLTGRILAARFQALERIDAGRIAAMLNNDAQSLGQTLPLVMPLATNAVTTVVMGLYLATVSLQAFLVAAAVIAVTAALFIRVDRGTVRFWRDESRAHARFLGLVDGLMRGFKELSMHAAKRLGFAGDMEAALAELAGRRTRAAAMFLRSFILGETLLVGALGTIAFLFPRFLDGFDAAQLTTFVMGLLYIIGPLNSILRAVPTATEARATWGRIRAVEAELAAGEAGPAAAPPARSIERLTIDAACFQYPPSDDGPGFGVGPASFDVASGEIVFVVGGNGSGKTTLAKLLTGLYRPTAGRILIDGRVVGPDELGELVSVVFGDFHLFPRLYDVALAGKAAVVDHHLEVLRLKDKVALDDTGFSTLDLSSGQRKRLALLKCLLEDRPILLFDEWAADQDPEFRQTFYRDLLPALRQAGKLVIAITHDERYFDVADRIVGLELGRMSHVTSARKAS